MPHRCNPPAPAVWRISGLSVSIHPVSFPSRFAYSVRFFRRIQFVARARRSNPFDLVIENYWRDSMGRIGSVRITSITDWSIDTWFLNEIEIGIICMKFFSYSSYFVKCEVLTTWNGEIVRIIDLAWSLMSEILIKTIVSTKFVLLCEMQSFSDLYGIFLFLPWSRNRALKRYCSFVVCSMLYKRIS